MACKTCTHTYDNGNTCNSAAVKDRDFCYYHLRHRGRLMRMARARTRNQRLFFQLPPLEDMFAVQSALTQLAEALAADMIDPKRAQVLLSLLRQAGKNLQTSGKWTTNVYHSDRAAPYDSFESEFDLPAQLDLNLAPELAFPPPESNPYGLSARAQAAAVEGSAVSPFPTADGQPITENIDVRPDFPVTPEMVEIVEVSQTPRARTPQPSAAVSCNAIASAVSWPAIVSVMPRSPLSTT